MTVKPSTHGNFVRGVDASAGVLTQPKGTVPRGSNLLLTKRGSLHTCDGSGGLFYFNGNPTAGRGKMLVLFLYQPIGVSNYYLALAQALDLPIGPPQNLTVSTGAGGTLAAATYFYKVTAIDGVGGETTASNEVSQVTGANGKNTLTWNVVPNAAGYRIYRSTSSGTEVALSSSGIPVSQVGSGTLTASFVDDGSGTQTAVTVTSAIISFVSGVGSLRTYAATFTVPSTAGLIVGQVFTYIPGSNPNFGTTWQINGIIDGQNFSASHGPAAAIPGLAQGSTTTGGSFLSGSVPVADTTQQIVLFKMPVIAGDPAVLPVSYNNSNIVALYPALLTTFATVGGGGGGSGGGGGTGGGGSTGGGGGGGRPIF